jgi:hypothetical protein
MPEFEKDQNNSVKGIRNHLKKKSPDEITKFSDPFFLQTHHPHLASIPDFNMADFNKSRAFSRHTA